MKMFGKSKLILLTLNSICGIVLGSCATVTQEQTTNPTSTNTIIPTGIPEPTNTATPTAMHTPTTTPTQDPMGDPDGDGICTYFEEVRGTDPFLFDTDGDGHPDFEFDEIGEYAKIIKGMAILKAPPWDYLIEHDSDLNADVHQYHEIMEKDENELQIRFILFDVKHKIDTLNPINSLQIIGLEGSRIEASDQSKEELIEILNTYNPKNDYEAMYDLKKWFLSNFNIAALDHSSRIIDGKRVDGFTIDNFWTGEELFQIKKSEACGSHATLTSFLGNNIGIPTRIVHSVPVDERGPNHFTNESYISGNWIPIDINSGDEINYRDPILLKIDLFRDFGEVDFSLWDNYFATTDYWSPTGIQMKGLYDITSITYLQPSN